ncbi:MAG: diphosphomevalonate decarboxylase [Polyangiaceae bacterium]|jgi:diphosphomevalonate decarboxylase|nr:diphosphomevalonate decarboxylase [Polyangiaceae bacterium]
MSETGTRSATARAHANIALAKYWGKTDEVRNLPAVTSVSVTLAALSTTTRVVFDPQLTNDELWLDGEPQAGRPLERVANVLHDVRRSAGLQVFARVDSSNNCPTASGLASSASAFAALALASTAAARLPVDMGAVSDLARRASASAARSVQGGFVRLAAGSRDTILLASEQLAPANHWDLRIVVAVTSDKRKRVSSTHGMLQTAQTSPYYEAWVALCPSIAKRVEAAIASRDLHALGEAAERSALAMHACAMAAAPGLVYFEPATVAVLHAVRSFREHGVLGYATIDAGPHVKVITDAEHVQTVAELMGKVPGVLRTVVSTVGGPAILVDEASAC